jgi:hypothetical protein
MFCTSCGKATEEGKAFCTNCGAPVSQTSGQAAPEAVDLGATAVRPAVGATPPATPPPASPQAPPPAAGPGAYGAGWQPPQGSAKGNRTGLIVGMVFAAIIVLAAAGVGLWLGLRGDDAATTGATTAGTVAGDVSGTVQTIPGVDGSSDGAGVTVPGGDDATEYAIAAENLVMEMDYENGRIPELADMINDSRPDVPASVRDELVTMGETLGAARMALDGLLLPEELVEAHGWLGEAAVHMANRIQATIDGIELMWDTDSPSAGNAAFDEGRAERDAYLDAMDEYWAHMPGD